MNFEKIKEWVINNILTILTIIFPTITGVFTVIVGKASESINWLTMALIVIVMIFSIITIIKTIWNIISYKSYHYPWLKIRKNYNYEIIEKKITYKRTKDDILHYYRYINIKACSNRINSIYDKYIWTGCQTNILRIEPITGIINIQNRSRIGIWRYIMIELDNHISKGETKELYYKWPDIGSCSKSSPFFQFLLMNQQKE